MLRRVVRVLLGFALASLAAAFTLVVFVYAPADWASLRADLTAQRLAEAGILALVVTPHIAVYAALPVLAGVILAEMCNIARWTFYALVGIVVAVAGLVALHLAEAPGQASIVHNYVLAAFLTAGLIGGLTYWAFSGRLVAKPPAAAAPARGSSLGGSA